jgi:hypothetical protein
MKGGLLLAASILFGLSFHSLFAAVNLVRNGAFEGDADRFRCFRNHCRQRVLRLTGGSAGLNLPVTYSPRHLLYGDFLTENAIGIYI